MPRAQVQDPPPPTIKWIERSIVGCLFLIALFAPHSIAFTQTAWLLGLILWLIRLALYPRPNLFRTPVDYALLGFFILSGVSAVFSYNPVMSIGKMRAASLFTLFYLDTVFQPGLKIKATVKDGRVYAPGVGDDTRNIEALLATMRALDAAKIKTKGDLIFLFTTDEEAGMTGAKHYTRENKDKVNYYIALDGGYEGFTYAGIGINWYRHHFIGPGGHTRSRTPPYSASLPLARAISRIYELKVPTSPSSNLNIGMLGGSEVPNAKAADAWFTVDLRSTDNNVIADLEKKIAAILDEEANRTGTTVKTDIISTSPAAVLPGNRESHLVKMAEAVHRAMGFDPPISNAGANNSSVALLQGITSISTGAGPCSDSHALTENCEIEPLYKGIKKIMLLAVSLAQLSN